jgi:hypothetical protein
MRTNLDVIVRTIELDNEDNSNPLPADELQVDEGVEEREEADVLFETCSSPMNWAEDLMLDESSSPSFDSSLQCLLSPSDFAVQYQAEGSNYPDRISIQLENKSTLRWEIFTLNSGQSHTFSLSQYKSLKVLTSNNGLEHCVPILGGTRYAIVVRQNAWTIIPIASPANS